MRSGRLKRSIVIEYQPAGSPRQSSSGMRTDGWGTFATVRGNIRPLSARELRAADQVQSEVAVEIEIRYVAGIVAGMRATHLGVTYQIHGVRDPEMDQMRLVLSCSAGVVSPTADAL